MRVVRLYSSDCKSSRANGQCSRTARFIASKNKTERTGKAVDLNNKAATRPTERRITAFGECCCVRYVSSAQWHNATNPSRLTPVKGSLLLVVGKGLNIHSCQNHWRRCRNNHVALDRHRLALIGWQYCRVRAELLP